MGIPLSWRALCVCARRGGVPSIKVGVRKKAVGEFQVAESFDGGPGGTGEIEVTAARMWSGVTEQCT